MYLDNKYGKSQYVVSCGWCKTIGADQRKKVEKVMNNSRMTPTAIISYKNSFVCDYFRGLHVVL